VVSTGANQQLTSLALSLTHPKEAALTTIENQTGTASEQAPGRLPDDLREGYAEIGDVRLHYVEAGEGPLVADIRGLIHERGAESAMLVGHDWGGTVAWDLAMNHPEVVDRLAILNAAHPRKLSQGLHHPGQLRKSWYFFFFDLPDLPETVVHANGWHFFRHFLRDARPAFTPEQTDRYVEAWSQPGAATAMIDYYRSSVRTPPKKAEAQIHPVKAPTLVIWGERDRYLGPELAEPEHDDVPNLDRVERLPDASHWVHHDEAERVTQLLIDFFAPALPAK